MCQLSTVNCQLSSGYQSHDKTTFEGDLSPTTRQKVEMDKIQNNADMLQKKRRREIISKWVSGLREWGQDGEKCRWVGARTVDRYCVGLG